MAELNVQQKNIVNQLRQAYPELKSYSDEQILSLYNQQLNNIQLSEDERISIMNGRNGISNDGMGLRLEGTQTSVSKEQEAQLKSALTARLNAVSTNVKKAEDSNGFLGSMWSGFKNLTGIGDSSDKVREQQKADLKALESGNIAEAFKQITGLDYTIENVNKFLNNEVQTKSETALNGYTEGQEMASDITADIVSGIAAVGIYTAAVAAAPFTGGASIVVGVAAAGASAAAIKTGIKYADAKSGGREYTADNLKKDLATGAFSGVLAPITGGMGGAVGKTAAKALGIQAVKQVGKEVAEEAVEQTAKGFVKTMLTNPTGYEYIGGNMVKRGLAFAAEAATDGAIGGAVDNAFRTAYDGGSLEDIGNSAVEGFVGGAIMSPVIGGGMKVAGKGAQKIFGKNNVDIDANGNRVRVNDDGTVVRIDENGNEIGDAIARNVDSEQLSITDRLSTASSREEFVAIRDEIKAMPAGAEKTALQQEYLRKYNEFSRKYNEEFDIRMEYKPDEKIIGLKAKFEDNPLIQRNIDKLAQTGLGSSHIADMARFLNIPENVVDDYIALWTRNGDSITPDFLFLVSHLFDSEMNLKPNYQDIVSLTKEMFITQNLKGSQVAGILHFSNLDKVAINKMLPILKLDGMDTGTYSSIKHVCKLSELVDSNSITIKDIEEALTLTPEQILTRNGKPLSAEFILKLLDGKKYTPEQVKIIKDLVSDKTFVNTVDDKAIEMCNKFSFDIEKLDLFKKLFAINSTDINITSYVILRRENVIAEHLATLKVLFDNKAFIRQDKIFAMHDLTNIDVNELEKMAEYINLVKENDDLIKNLNFELLNKENYSITIDLVNRNKNIKYEQLLNEVEEIKIQEKIKYVNEPEFKELAYKLEKIGYETTLYLPKLEELMGKLDGVKDEFLVVHIQKMLKECVEAADNKSFGYNYNTQIQRMNDLLDIYHTFNLDYEYIGSKSNPTAKRQYFDFNKKVLQNNEFLNRVSHVFEDNTWQKFDETKIPKLEIITKDFAEESRIERLRSYCKNNPNDEFAEYFYKEYYINNPNIPQSIKDICIKINEEFNVKIFLSHDTTGEKVLDFVYRELSEWKTASQGTAVMPPIIDFSAIKTEYINEKSAYGQGTAAAYSDNTRANDIAIDTYAQAYKALRHEMTHSNDLKKGIGIDKRKYNLDEIMPKKPMLDSNGNVITDQFGNPIEIPIFEKCLYKEEFERAGIPSSTIEYAYNNPEEFIAVASEGDMSKYSPEFKQMLIDFGMPEWMFSMKQLNTTSLNNIAEIDFIITEAKKYPIYDENGIEIDITKRYDILTYFGDIYDECSYKAFLTSEELKRHNIPNEPKKLFEYILPRHEEKDIILGDMDLICKIMKGELDEVTPKVEIPAELVAVEERLITTLNSVVKAKRPKAVNHLENINEILKNPEDKLALLSYLNKNPNWYYFVDDLNFTPQNIRLLRELKPLLNEDNISFPALLSFLNNEKISNNLNTEKFMAFIKPLYEKGINLEFMSGTGSKQALEVVAEMFSRKSDDLPKVEYLLKLWESNQKDYPFYYTSLILDTVEDWDVVINRNLIEYKDANGRKFSYGDIFAYSKLTDDEWNNVLKRNLLSLKEDYGKHLTKGATDTFNDGNNDATYLAKLTDDEWNFVVNNRLLEKYNGFQLLELAHNTQNINGVEKNLLEIAMEKGIISIKDSKFPTEINPQDIEIMCNIENWSTLVRNNVFDSLTTRDYFFSINGSLGLKLEKLSTITDDISWQRIKEHNLLKYENAEDIIALAQLDEDKFARFIRLKDTEFSQYNKGIGELASLEPEMFAKVQKDLLGKVDSAEAICKLLKLEPEEYDYIVKKGLISGKILHETTVDLIVNLRKFIGKKNLNELSKAEKRELLWLLMENKQNFESSKFNFSEHDGALPLLKGEYKDIIDAVISDLGIYADDFSPEVKLEYSNLLSKLSKPQNNIDNLIDDITSLIPEFKYLGNLRDEITKTIKQLEQKADFHKLSDSDKKVLLTATLLEKCSTSSLDDSAFDASIIVRRLGFSKSEIKKVSNIIKNANLIADFMKLNKETLSITTPVGVVLESEARQLQLDRIAFSLKEGNTFEIAKMLYSTKETEGLSRYLDKLIKNRIQEIKAHDFVLPQFTIRSWIEGMSKDPKWLEQHTIGGRLIIYKNELPNEYLGFVHCTDNTAATGGNTGTNIANFDLFAIPNDKVICASYISKENWGTFGGNGLLLSTGNSSQLVGAGYDIWSFGKDTDGILMEYYRDRGLVSHNEKLKFKHRTLISDSLKEILFGVNYSELCEARRVQVLELENLFRPQILELNDNRIALIHRLARENNLDPNSITNKQYQELRKMYPEIIKIEQQIKDLETQLSTRINNIKENSIIKEIDSKYIERVDKLKEFEHPISLAEIKNIDEELYNAYVEYFSRVPSSRIDDTSLLRSSYHNEVLLNEVDVDAYMVTVGGDRTNIYELGAIPEDFLQLSRENNIPLIITN